MKNLPAKELSLRPYPGTLYLAKNRKSYEKAHRMIYKTVDIISCDTDGRYSAGCAMDDTWTYLVWGNAPHTLAHELAHVILHVFGRCGIDPREAGGEPFCYMLSQLLLEAK